MAVERVRSRLIDSVALCVGGVAWVSLALQLVIAIRVTLADGGTVATALMNYFGYFTILTNLLVALVLTLPPLVPASRAARVLDDPRTWTTAAVSITLVGVVYHLLLRGQWDPRGVQLLVDYGLHSVVPFAFVVLWLVAAPTQGLSLRALPAIGAYPVVYVAYIFARGTVLGRYPYYFMDARSLGAWGALRNSVGRSSCTSAWRPCCSLWHRAPL